MHYVSLIVEFLRGRPAVVFWTAALAQAALWTVLPALFYSGPPGDLALSLAVGHEFRLGSHFGPPLAFWIAELVFRIAGLPGVYLLGQICIVVAFWAVFALGRAIVGARHAALAVLLMTGVALFSVPTPEFGPAVLALPLWALALLHYWRAVGEGRRGAWFLLAFDLGLLLLTSYAGIVLTALLVLFSLMRARARAALRFVEPWAAALLLLFVLAPFAVWLRVLGQPEVSALVEARGTFGVPEASRTAALFLLAHLGLIVLVVVASGWPYRRRTSAPRIERGVSDAFGRAFVYFFAVTPILAGVLLALFLARPAPLQQSAPFALLTGLAVVAAAGDQVWLYRERIVSFAWLGLLIVPPVMVALAVVVLPWVFPTDLRIAQPAAAMGRFFSENFQRRTGQPLAVVAGDPHVASLVAAAAPTRPVLFLDGAPERSPWTDREALRAKGGILVWPATDPAGTAPAALRSRFPEMVAELPRVFERPVQGFLPPMRIGWAVIRPSGQAAAR